MGWISDHALDARIWDVEHGSAAYIRAVSKNVVIDCGAGTNPEFSPLRYLRGPATPVNTIHYMIISHPHHDHIEDLDKADDYNLKPKIIDRPKAARSIIEEKLEEERENGNEDYVEDAEYYLMLDDYSHTPDPLPSDPSWSLGGSRETGFRTDGYGVGGVTIHNYGSDNANLGNDRYERLNNLSRLTVVKTRGFTMVTAGDILEEGMNELLNNEEAMDACEDASVLVAPHHGRDSSYEEEFVDHVDPDLVVFSDKSRVSNSARDDYASHATGKRVTHEDTETNEVRKVVTTRNDGRIRIQATNEDDWEVSLGGREYNTDALAETHQYQNATRYRE